MRVSRIARRVIAITVAWCLLATSAAAAPPDAGPEEIRRVGFEVGETDPVNPENPLLEALPGGTGAFWGYSSLWKRTGDRGLWCAGSSAETTRYPAGTMGRTTLRFRELADYYESRLEFWYLIPTVGSAEDVFNFSAGRIDAAGSSIGESLVRHEFVDTFPSWVQYSYPLATALSRSGARFTWGFVDSIEGEGLLSKQGQGPAIDDVVLTGYRFGPVRSLSSTWSASPAAVVLSWTKPATSATNSAEDTRTISYRVWRSAAGADTWTELTAGGRITATTFVDETAHVESAYDYVVQAWDPDAGTGRGRQTALRVLTPGAPPVAEPDAYMATEDETLTVSAPGLLGNDAGASQLSAVLVSEPSHGNLALNPDGSFTYMPDLDFNGDDEFAYRASDGSQDSQAATVAITVSPVADPTVIAVTSASATLSKYGDSYTFTGRLTMKGAPVAGGRVHLQSSSSATGTFTDTGASTLTAADGSFTLRHLPRDRTFYRVRFAGEADEYLPSVSAVRSALPRAQVGTPVAPKTMYRNRSTRVYGTLRPQHASGTVRLYIDRYVGGKPRRYAVLNASVSKYSDHSRYSRSVKLPYAGKWRIRAYHADTGHAASWSGTRYVTVR